MSDVKARRNRAVILPMGHRIALKYFGISNVTALGLNFRINVSANGQIGHRVRLPSDSRRLICHRMQASLPRGQLLPGSVVAQSGGQGGHTEKVGERHFGRLIAGAIKECRTMLNARWRVPI